MTHADYDVFISYARADTPRARVIREKLAALGFRVFFDTEGIDTGEEFPDIIDRAVKGARCVLGLWSRAAFTGRWVRIESRIGLDQKKLVAVTLDGLRPEELPAEFYNVNVEPLVNFRGEDDHASWARIVRAIAKRTGRSDLASFGGDIPVTAPAPTQITLTPQQKRYALIGAGVAAAIALVAFNPFHIGPSTVAASEQVASTPALDISGAWRGSFSEAGRDTAFELTLSAAGGDDGGQRFSGRVSEGDTFNIAGVQTISADITAESRPGGGVSFSKSYTSAGAFNHTVSYDGRIDASGHTITGTWRSGSLSGPFRMERAG